jgi:hypothetical protein
LQFWSLNSGRTPWATPPALFYGGFFKIGPHGTICLGWLQTTILLISASWVARIIGVSHRCLAGFTFLILFFFFKYEMEWESWEDKNYSFKLMPTPENMNWKIYQLAEFLRPESNFSLK